MRQYRPHPALSKPTPWDRLGIPEEGAELVTRLHQGFPVSTLQQLADNIGIDTKTLAQAISITPSTLNRRIKAGRFSTTESDSVFRLATVILSAQDLFEGDALSAKTWLQSPEIGLEGRSLWRW